MTNATLTGERILVTGASGWVAGPLAASLAADGNEVFGAARFADPSTREPLEAAGVRTVAIDLATRTFDEIPPDLDLVLHFAVAKVPDFAAALDVNGEATADLIERVAARSDGLRAVLHCSSTAVYQPNGHQPLRETDPLGDNHRPQAGLETYSISKIASESFARYQARRLGIPTVIARLNVPYGDTYGWPLMHVLMMEHGIAVPVHTDAPTSFAPIHAEDIHASVPFLLRLASTPATTVNWGGSEVVSVEEWCAYLGELTGLAPVFETTDATIGTVIPDLGVLDSTGFRPDVGWRDGMRRMVATSRPDLYTG
jgi:UDP-glucuronate 4-epimerase